MRTLKLICLMIAASCGTSAPPGNASCPDDLVETELFARTIKGSGQAECASEELVSIGLFCLEPTQYDEDIAEYRREREYLIIEPHNEHAISELLARGFRLVAIDESLPACEDM